jgi:hypothetical protein
VKTLAGIVVLSLAAAAVGCRASPLKDRFDSVGKEISSARAAGAPKYAPVDYDGAKEALDLAKDSESSAVSAREDAEQAREKAKQDLGKLKKQTADREAALDEAEKRRAGADAYLASLKRREAELRAKGVTEREIDKALGDQIVLTQLEANAARAQIKTIKAEIELLAISEQEASARIASASDGIAVSGQQLIHASALCDTAGASARMAEAHAIAKRKAELEVH